MQKLLKILLSVLGVASIAIALLHVALGPAAIPGAVPVNATMDSEDRFYATMFLAFGAAAVWCGLDAGRRTRQIELLALVFFCGGAARLISMAAVGPPNAFFVAMTAIELLLPVLLVWLARSVRAATPEASAS